MAQIENRTIESVVHVITDAGPHPYFQTLIESGRMERSALTVGCVGAAGALQAEMVALGVSTFALGATGRAAYPIAAIRLARLLRRSRAQIVQTHLVDGCLVGLAAARLARTPVPIMTAHHSHELPFHGRRLLWPERLCAGPLSDHIIAPSREVARTLMSLVRVPENKIEIVHHGFDLDRLDPRKIDGARVRRELGLDGKLVFGAIGRIYRLKNYAALIEAFATGLGAVPQTCLVIVGPGDRRPLSSLASTLGIGDRVFLIGPRSDVPDVLAAFDAFVHPAIAESFGMVIVEAMAMGRPVLSTPVGIAREVITPPQNGLLSASPEPEALAVGLRALLELRPRWAEIGAAARRRVEGFTAEAMAKRHQELYVRWLNAAGHDSMSMIPDGSR